MTISLSLTLAIYGRFVTIAISFSSMFSLIPLKQIVPIGQMSLAFQRVLTQTVNLSIGFDSSLKAALHVTADRKSLRVAKLTAQIFLPGAGIPQLHPTLLVKKHRVLGR